MQCCSALHDNPNNSCLEDYLTLGWNNHSLTSRYWSKARVCGTLRYIPPVMSAAWKNKMKQHYSSLPTFQDIWWIMSRDILKCAPRSHPTHSAHGFSFPCELMNALRNCLAPYACNACIEIGWPSWSQMIYLALMEINQKKERGKNAFALVSLNNQGLGFLHVAT